MSRFSGVVIDFYDDKGATLKTKFPTASDLPEVIKTASVTPKDQVPDESFALLATDGGTVIKKYACDNAGTTAMSVLYFMEHGDKLPEVAREKVAANLTRACLNFGIVPPVAMTKTAAALPFNMARSLLRAEARVPGVIQGIRGIAPGAAMGAVPGAVAGAVSAPPGETFSGALKGGLVGGAVGGIGGGLYGGALARHTAGRQWTAAKPSKRLRALYGMNDVKRLRGEGALNMDLSPYLPSVSMPQQVKTSSVVDITGKSATPKGITKASHYMYQGPSGSKFPIDSWDQVKMAERYLQDNGVRMDRAVYRSCAVKLAARAADTGYPLDGKIKEAGATTYASMESRLASMGMRKQAGADPKFLDELFVKSAALEPEVTAEVLRRFDIQSGLDKLWGNRVPDPWESTFGIQKTAEVVWESGADRVTDEALRTLAMNKIDLVNDKFTRRVADEFKKDPVGIFNSMPEPEKRLFARLANDVSGESYGDIPSPEKTAMDNVNSLVGG